MGLGSAELETFANGEIYCRYGESIRGADVSLLQSDTVTLDPVSLPGKVTIVTAADLLADSIRNVFAGRSVSALFGGENELF